MSSTFKPNNNNRNLVSSTSVFNLGYLPEKFLFREKETDRLVANIQSALCGGEIVNTLLQGPTSTGKTTCALRVLEVLREEQNEIVPVTVYCQKNRTEYRVISIICTELTGIKPPNSGVPVDVLVERISDYLIDKKRSLLVFLDDVDYLLFENALKPVFSRLLRMCGKNALVRVGIIATVSDRSFNLISELDSATTAVLHMDSIRFLFYSVDEVTGILMDRVRLGLLEGVITPELVRVVAERCCDCTDLRLGIGMLREAALRAGRNGRSKILQEDVDAVYFAARRMMTRDVVSSLPDTNLNVLRMLAEAQQNHPDIQTTREFFEAVREKHKVSDSTLSQRVRELQRLHLIGLEKRDCHGNSHILHLCDFPDELVGMCDEFRQERDELAERNIWKKQIGWKRLDR